MIYEAILELNKAIGKSGQYSLSRRAEWTEDDKARDGWLTLTMGNGYFSGSLLKVEALDDSGFQRLIDRPIETNARSFADGKVPGPDDPWVLS